jgi:hypothetical protein
MLILLAASLAAAADDPYPTRAVDRPLVLPKGVGRVTLDSGVTTWSQTRAFESAGLRTVLQGGIGLGRVDLGLTTSATLVPAPYWERSLCVAARVSAVDARRVDWAPEVLLAALAVWSPMGSVVVDPGLRWSFAEDLVLSFGHGDDPWEIAGFARGLDWVAVPLDLALAAQATDAVAVSLRTSFGALDVLHLEVVRPPWQRPNGAVGVRVVPTEDLDVDGLLGLSGTFLPPEFGSPPSLGVDLRVGVTTRW